MDENVQKSSSEEDQSPSKKAQYSWRLKLNIPVRNDENSLKESMILYVTLTVIQENKFKKN